MADEGEKPAESLAPFAIGCGLLAMVLTCFGPMIAGMAFTFWARSTVPAILSGAGTAPAPPTPAAGSYAPPIPGYGGPHMPPPPVPPADLAPTSRVAYLTVESVSGLPIVTPGTTCVLFLDHDPSAELRCHVTDFRCLGVHLYGSTSQGFYPCDGPEEPDGLRRGSDDAPTADDGDPIFAVTADRVLVADPDGEHGAFEIALVRDPPAE